MSTATFFLSIIFKKILLHLTHSAITKMKVFSTFTFILSSVIIKSTFQEHTTNDIKYVNLFFWLTSFTIWHILSCDQRILLNVFTPIIDRYISFNCYD